MDNERYADSAQARGTDKAYQREQQSGGRFVLTPEQLEARAIRQKAERVASAKRIRGAIGKMQVFFGYAE